MKPILKPILKPGMKPPATNPALTSSFLPEGVFKAAPKGVFILFLSMFLASCSSSPATVPGGEAPPASSALPSPSPQEEDALPGFDEALLKENLTLFNLSFSGEAFSALNNDLERSNRLTSVVSNITGGPFVSDLVYKDDGSVLQSFRLSSPLPLEKEQEAIMNIKEIDGSADVSFTQEAAYRFKVLAGPSKLTAEKVDENFQKDVAPLATGTVASTKDASGIYTLAVDGNLAENSSLEKIFLAYAKALDVKASSLTVQAFDS